MNRIIIVERQPALIFLSFFALVSWFEGIYFPQAGFHPAASPQG
jgi:hypothetical protein